MPPDVTASMHELRIVVFDFDGVFTDNHVFVDETGREMVRCTREDGIGLSRLRETGVASMILSTEVNPVVSRRARKLKIECEQGCEDKRSRLTAILEDRGIEPDRAAFVGNDINDAGALELVGLPIVVADADEAVLPLARWRTGRLGGDGAVREVCEAVIAARAGASVP